MDISGYMSTLANASFNTKKMKRKLFQFFYGKINKNRGFSRLEKNWSNRESSWMSGKQALVHIKTNENGTIQGESSRRNAENGMSQSQGLQWLRIWWGTWWVAQGDLSGTVSYCSDAAEWMPRCRAPEAEPTFTYLRHSLGPLHHPQDRDQRDLGFLKKLLDSQTQKRSRRVEGGKKKELKPKLLISHAVMKKECTKVTSRLLYFS